jgi:SAM-dependent MidA family methyltransferase
LNPILKAKLAADGPMTFAQFMELALYQPEHGYYEQPASRLGKRGDFFTSVSVGPLFGSLWAGQFAQWAWPAHDQSLIWLEAGAHDGQLAADFLMALKQQQPDCWERMEYWVLEPSARRQKWQAEALQGWHPKVKWFARWADLPATGVCGVVFSNELLDAFPVHRLGWSRKSGSWFEWGVTWESGRFEWIPMPGNPEVAAELSDAPPELLAVLPDGFMVDLCPDATLWWEEAARRLRSGWLVAVDYGLTAEQRFAPGRANGTLRAYTGHRLATDVLARPGEQDLTADVNFSALIKAGERMGLHLDTFVTQSQFLTRIGAQMWAAGVAWDAAQTRQFQTLTHPEHLGRAFRVLVQRRSA